MCKMCLYLLKHFIFHAGKHMFGGHLLCVCVQSIISEVEPHDFSLFTCGETHPWGSIVLCHFKLFIVVIVVVLLFFLPKSRMSFACDHTACAIRLRASDDTVPSGVSPRPPTWSYGHHPPTCEMSTNNQGFRIEDDYGRTKIGHTQGMYH